jgi:hypothetical protein
LLIAGDWTQVNVPEVSADWALTGLDFCGSAEGWAVGVDYDHKTGVILHYANGAWSKAELPTVSSEWSLRQVQLFSANEGWAVGEDAANKKGLALHYFNGSWTVTELPPIDLPQYELHALYFLNQEEGWAAGGNDNGKGGVFLHYKNGVWTNEGSPENLKGHLLRAVHAFSPDNVWIGGQNEGDLWGITAFSRPWGTFEMSVKNGVWEKVDQPLLGRNFIRTDYFFFNDKDGWVVGFMPLIDVNTGGKIAHWNGKKWSMEKVDDVSKHWDFRAIEFSDAKNGWACGLDSKGDRGFFMQYADGKWTLISKKKIPQVSDKWGLYALSYDNASDWWAVGIDFKNEKGCILHLGK